MLTKKCPKDSEEIMVEKPNEFTDSIAKECPKCGKLIIFRRGQDY